MTGETRRVLRDDLVLGVAALAIFVAFAVTGRCQESPSHFADMPTVAEWQAASDGEPMTCLSLDSWERILDRLELAEAAAVERDAALRAADAQALTVETLRAHVAGLEKERDALRDEAAEMEAELIALRRQTGRRWAWFLGGTSIGLLAGEAAR